MAFLQYRAGLLPKPATARRPYGSSTRALPVNQSAHARGTSRLRRRAGPVKVVAYRDAHREQEICGVGREFVDAWFKGVEEGSEKALPCIQQVLARDASCRASQVVKTDVGKGTEFVRKRIDYERQQLNMSDHKIIASAACGEDDTYFALIEYNYQYGNNAQCKGYKVMVLEMEFDDTVRRVKSIIERGQLAPEDVQSLSEEAGRICNLTPFPEKEVKSYPAGLDHLVVKKYMKDWCAARSSSNSEDILDKVLHPDFKLWDAYGMLPMLCDPKRRAEPDACVMTFDNVKDLVKDCKSSYDIDCHQLSSATSTKHNVAFNHWCSHIKNKADGNKYDIEGIEVDLFAEDGRLKDIWLFRDPMEHEAQQLAM